MSGGNKHGGKRKGAGAKQKWDLFFKLEVGQACEELIRNSEKLAMRREKCELFESMTDLTDVWDRLNMVPIYQRSDWLKSEAGDQHRSDMEDELETLRAVTANISPNSRLLKLSITPPRGTRSSIILAIAEKYFLSAKQVDNLWQEYRRFERSLSDQT